MPLAPRGIPFSSATCTQYDQWGNPIPLGIRLPHPTALNVTIPIPPRVPVPPLFTSKPRSLGQVMCLLVFRVFLLFKYLHLHRLDHTYKD
ncbi:hypothetical protein Hdeb2414_s0011g00370461 [Helianthus debilis subsp. tardiflorus]